MKKSHTSHHPPSRELADVLRRSKHSLPKAAETGQGIAPGSVVEMIATGRITRGRSCDGKKRYRTYDYAENTIRPLLESKYNSHYEVYACCFCDGWHLASTSEFAA